MSDINLLTLRSVQNKRLYISFLLSTPQLGIMLFAPFEVEIGLFWLVIAFGYQHISDEELEELANRRTK